uniref:Uncharacterized protein n=1 Tax=Moniliophthora roreri TaxID=221103 RepID=A0A0W0G0V7_MONRR
MAIPVPMQELFTVQSVFVKPITAVGLTLLLSAVGLATAITKIIVSVDTSNPALYELYKKTINYQIGYYCANPPVNVMITLMIGTTLPSFVPQLCAHEFHAAGRIWWVARDIRRAIPGPRQSKAIHRDYKTVIAMTLESGLVYSMVRIVHAGNAGAIGVPINLAPASILVAGIAPTFVILQSNLIRSVQRGQTDKSISLQFELTSVKQ